MKNSKEIQDVQAGKDNKKQSKNTAVNSTQLPTAAAATASLISITPADVKDNVEFVKVEAQIIETPQNYLCPISQEIMMDPVVALDGHSYNRNSIQQWFKRGNRLSPMIGTLLKDLLLIDNLTLKSVISDFQASLPQIQRERQQLQVDLEIAVKHREEFIAEVVRKLKLKEEQEILTNKALSAEKAKANSAKIQADDLALQNQQLHKELLALKAQTPIASVSGASGGIPAIQFSRIDAKTEKELMTCFKPLAQLDIGHKFLFPDANSWDKLNDIEKHQYLSQSNITEAYGYLSSDFRKYLSENTQKERHAMAEGGKHPSVIEYWNKLSFQLQLQLVMRVTKAKGNIANNISSSAGASAATAEKDSKSNCKI